jgi:hypothetical protein
MGLLFGASNRLVNLAEPANGILASATFMDSNGQGFRIQVRQKISFGFEDLPDQSACVVGTRQVIAEQGNQAGLGAISNHFDGVDEVRALGAQATLVICDFKARC